MTLQWVDNQGLYRGVQGQCPAPSRSKQAGIQSGGLSRLKERGRRAVILAGGRGKLC